MAASDEKVRKGLALSSLHDRNAKVAVVMHQQASARREYLNFLHQQQKQRDETKYLELESKRLVNFPRLKKFISSIESDFESKEKSEDNYIWVFDIATREKISPARFEKVLFKAIKEERYDVIDELIQFGVNLKIYAYFSKFLLKKSDNDADFFVATPIYYALYILFINHSGRRAKCNQICLLIEKLIIAGCPLNFKHSVYKNESLLGFFQLEDAREDENSQDWQEYELDTFLHKLVNWAVRFNGLHPLLTFVLKQGANVNCRDERNDTPLSLALKSITDKGIKLETWYQVIMILIFEGNHDYTLKLRSADEKNNHERLYTILLNLKKNNRVTYRRRTVAEISEEKALKENLKITMELIESFSRKPFYGEEILQAKARFYKKKLGLECNSFLVAHDILCEDIIEWCLERFFKNVDFIYRDIEKTIRDQYRRILCGDADSLSLENFERDITQGAIRNIKQKYTYGFFLKEMLKLPFNLLDPILNIIKNYLSCRTNLLIEKGREYYALGAHIGGWPKELTTDTFYRVIQNTLLIDCPIRKIARYIKLFSETNPKGNKDLDKKEQAEESRRSLFYYYKVSSRKEKKTHSKHVVMFSSKESAKHTVIHCVPKPVFKPTSIEAELITEPEGFLFSDEVRAQIDCFDLPRMGSLMRFLSKGL